MTELQTYQWIATGLVGGLATILWWWIRQVSDDMKAKLSREEFKAYLDDTAKSRTDLRESIIKLFERMDSSEKLTATKFEVVVKDFNGGLSRLAEKISDNQLDLLMEINGRVDRGK